MNKLLATTALAATLAFPMAASALTVNFYDSAVGGSVVHTATDDGAGDALSGISGVLSTAAVSVGGYTFAGSFSAVSNFPPIDAITSTFTVGAGGSSAGARIEVTNFFDSPVPTPLVGLGSVVNNLLGFAGDLVTTEVFIGSSSFGTDILVAGTSGSSSTAAGLETLLSSPYYITQVFTISGDSGFGGTATAEWTIPAPVPVPAAGGMLLTAFVAGGIVARRKKKAA